MTKSKLSSYAPLQPPCGTARVLTKADFMAIMGLREVVFAALPNRQFLYPEDDDEGFVRAHLGLHGMSVGVFEHEQLIGFTNLTLPDGDSLGEPWLGIPSRRIRRHHALLMNGIVRPGFEGNGLHKYLIAERLRIAEADDRPLARVLASPYNYRSWGNFIWHGFVVKGFIRPYEPKFGTLLRYVMDMDARQKLVGRKETSTLVDSNDIEKQEACFEQGMLGFNRVMDGPTAFIELMHPTESPIEY
ncbi:hypothetical protein SAMN05216525_114107 [Bradyrhizobium sp. Gha]|nr:hypothetical protein SAMN05216525_114107 [Bradyrhizobium sp. Gha]